MTDTINSQPSPTIEKPEVKTKNLDNAKQTAMAMNAMNKDIGAKAETLQAIGSKSKAALKNITGLLANIASYGIEEKIDYDEKGNQITDGIGYYKKRYRSSENFSENEDIAEAIEQQKQELKEAREAQFDFSVNLISNEDIMAVLDETNAELQARIFGPMWNNWTKGEDFIGNVKDTLENIINTFDPLMEIVDQLQEYIYGSVGDSLQNKGEISLYTSKRTGDTSTLPLGMIALNALSIIINYIRQLIQNIEMLAEEYSVEELNTLMRKGTSGSNYGTMMKTIQDLIQLIVNCIKPYIHNLVIAIMLDSIDIIIDVLDKAGLLTPKGPLKLIPVCITLIRAILKGDLEEIEEMVKQSVSKLINIFQIAAIAMQDPSILWADTDRMDKEIAIARYNDLTDNGKKKLDKDKFLNQTETSYTAGMRHFLQKMKGETQEQFNQVADLATTYTDLNIMYKKAIASNTAVKQNKQITTSKLKEAAERMNVYSESIAKEIQEVDYP